MSTLHAIDDTGDTRIQWNKVNADQVADARERFAKLKAKGYAAFKVNPGGGAPEQMDIFDPSAERVIMHPPMIGG